MSKTHTIQANYSGGGPNSINATTTNSGESDTNFDQACTASATTTLSPAVVVNPATCLSFALKSIGGNVTVHFSATSVTANSTTIGLVDGTPVIINGATGLPSGADTYTVKVRNAGSVSIAFEGRFLWP